MVWAQKNTRVLAVGLNFGSAPLTSAPALTIHSRTFEEADAGLRTGAYSAVVIDPTGRAEEAQRLADRVRALYPNVRVIFSARRAQPEMPLAGECLVAGNGRQFVRGLRAMLRC
jgi:hypothetical protein